MKDSYEISLWEDYLEDASGTPGEAGYVPAHYEERKLCVIGSDKMTDSYRAYAPELKSEINGTHTLTFKMYYTIKESEITVNCASFRIDEWGNFVVNGHTSEEQRTPTYSTFNLQSTKNPFLNLLVNERKVKCYWKGEWYDFIIKSCREDSNGKSITYTCTDVFINELSKTGFDIVLDTELENNSGTVLELAQTVLDGTDWQLDSQNSDTIQQKKEEPVYEVNTLDDWELTDQTAGVTSTILTGKKVLVFYQQVRDIVTYFENNPFTETIREIQIAYAENYEKDTNSQLVTNAHCYTSTVKWIKEQINDVDCLTISSPEQNNNTVYLHIFYKSTVSSNYRAERLVSQQICKLDPLTGKYCYVWTATQDGSGQWADLITKDDEIYEYRATEWNDALVVNNLMVNSKDFTNNEGWSGDDNLFFQLYPIFDPNDETISEYNAKSYLHLSDLHSSEFSKAFYNAGIRQSSNFIPDGFAIGEKYIFRYKAMTNVVVDEHDTPSGTYVVPTLGVDPIIPSIRTYKDFGAYKVIDTEGPVYFDVTQLGVNGDWVEWRLTCKKSVTRAEIYEKKVGLFLETHETLWLEEAQLFREVYGETTVEVNNNTSEESEQGTTQVVSVRINPGDIDVQSVSTIKYVYYNHTKNQGLLNPEDINYLWSSTTDWNCSTFLSPNYNTNFEKVRSISAKQSNRFNIIQSIAQTFECWVEFIINHDSTGKTIYIDGIPQKYVRFKRDIGQETGIGFVYGIDLKTITRTIQSDKIVTKTIVSKNSNEFATNGFCTISRSTENYPRTSFILNFDYYISQGLINGGIFNNDLYDSNGDIGYYYNLHNYNTRYDSLTEILEAKHLELTKQLSYQTVYDGTISGLQESISNLQGDLIRLADVSEWDQAAEWIVKNADQEQVKSRMIALETQRTSLNSYQDMKTKLDASISALQSLIANLENQQKDIIDDIKALDLKFYKKYSRFIQEGSWISEDYIDDTLYYLDAQSVAYTSSRPQISYEISVVRISGIEEFKNKVFHLGDIAFIQDTEFFGYTYINQIKTPYKEKVLISEIVSHFDEPEKDTFKVQNYKTQFEDLFQRITATTQSLQYASGEYARAASIVEPNGTIKPETLQNSFALNEQLVYSANNESVKTDNTGLKVTSLSDPNHQVWINSNGIFTTTDAGATWKNAVRGNGISASSLTAGSINTSEINIMDGNFQAFRWDESGISAYYKGSSDTGINLSKFVRFDHFGIYGIDNNSGNSYTPTTENQIWNDAKFGLTWKGLFIKNKYGSHYVEVSNTDDIRVVKTNSGNPIEVVKIGSLNPNAQTPNTIFGIRISDGVTGAPVMETDNTGKLWLKNRLNISSSSGNYSIGIGYLDTVEQETLHRVIDAHDNNNNSFIVYEDGSMRATGGTFTGTINATGGTIGGVTIAEVEQTAYRVVIESNAGTVFKNGQGQKTLTARLYKGDTEVTTGTFEYYWFLNTTPLSYPTTTQAITVVADSLNEVYTYSCNIRYWEPTT